MDNPESARTIIDLTGEEEDEWLMPPGLTEEEQVFFVQSCLEHKLIKSWEIHEFLKHKPTSTWEKLLQDARVQELERLQNEKAACEAFLEERGVIVLGKRKSHSPSTPASNKRRKHPKQADTATEKKFECMVCFEPHAPSEMVGNHCPKCSSDQPYQLCRKCHKEWKKRKTRTQNLCMNNCT